MGKGLSLLPGPQLTTVTRMRNPWGLVKCCLTSQTDSFGRALQKLTSSANSPVFCASMLPGPQGARGYHPILNASPYCPPNPTKFEIRTIGGASGTVSASPVILYSVWFRKCCSRFCFLLPVMSAVRLVYFYKCVYARVSSFVCEVHDSKNITQETRVPQQFVHPTFGIRYPGIRYPDSLF